MPFFSPIFSKTRRFSLSYAINAIFGHLYKNVNSFVQQAGNMAAHFRGDCNVGLVTAVISIKPTPEIYFHP
jgi:hypothetical protein